MSSVARVQVRVLGPIQVTDEGGRDITPDGGLQRRLLALLVLRRGHVVPVDVAVDVLWPSKAPRDPVAALHNHLSRLRAGLPDHAIESVGDGYRLDPGLIDLDADRLSSALLEDDLTDTILADAVLAAVDTLLEDWHGPAYPELADVDDGRAEATRLDELRVLAAEASAEQRLRRGDTAGLVAELALLADAEPLRERPRALLMAALAAGGRQAEALRVFDDFRRLVGAELGIEPSRALTTQHDELLAGTVEPATWIPSSRLPVPATGLLGRDELLADVVTLVDEHRLVTLVGPGGVGKTRLLVEVGHHLRARSVQPVVLCELAPADEHTAVDAVAAALGIDDRPDVPLAERLVDVLGDMDLVVLLDNCEHVLDPMADLVERLLARCPNLHIVATSRERLRLAGEHVGTVPPLSATDEGSPAAQLFMERARSVTPGFAPDEQERAGIAEIVRRLDGLPLAIELAAARLHALDVAEVAAGLDHRFALLSSGYRNSTRHGSLGAAVSWSVDLLDDDLRRTFADLSVFAGPFDVPAAAAVTGLDALLAADALTQLVERSLVLRTPDRRFLLLETLRDFGAEQLALADRADDVAGRHARHQVGWIESATEQLAEPGTDALARIDGGLLELRNALDWLLDHDEIDGAARLVAGLLEFGFFRLRPDVLAWSERVIAADPEDATASAPIIWVGAAYAAWMAGDVAETGARSARALEVAERAGGSFPPKVAEINGSHALFEGRLDDSASWYRRASECAEPGSPWRTMEAASELLALGYAGVDTTERSASILAEIGDRETPYAAWIWYCAGEADLGLDVERARERLTRALEIAHRTHCSFVAGIAGATKASLDARLGDPVLAAADYRRLIDHWRRAGMWSTQWTMLRSIAGLLDRLGRPRDAAILEGAVRRTDAGHRIFGADEIALDELGARLRAALGDGPYESARSEGGRLDGDAAVEHALRVLAPVPAVP